MQQNKFTPVNFSEQLSSLLASRGLTQKRFAKEVGVSEASVVKWLNGAMPLGQNLNRVAEYFGVSPDRLLNPEKYKEGDLADGYRLMITGMGGTGKSTYLSSLVQAGQIHDSTTGLRDGDAVYGISWKERCLAAEKQLASLKELLKGMADSIQLSE